MTVPTKAEVGAVIDWPDSPAYAGPGLEGPTLRWSGGLLMTEVEERFYVGRFVLDIDHLIQDWDEGLERLTGLKAADLVGTNRQWQAFHETEHQVLADYFLNHDLEGAREQYGRRSVWRIERNDEWLAIGQFFDLQRRPQPAIARVHWHRQQKAVVETIYLVEQISDWARISTDRFDGMKILAENVPAGVCLMQNNRIVFANRTFCSMFGYSTPLDLINRPPADFLVEDQRQRHLQMISNLNKDNSQSLRFQWTGLDKSGRNIWFEGRPVPIEWNGQPAVLSFVMDITEFKIREELMERESRELRTEYVRLKSSIDYRVNLGNIIGKSQKMQEVFESILRAAGSDSSLVIYGDTGTGKELVAKAVHALSRRSNAPFVPVNCGAIPGELFESEFFGYKKGAFTGAYANKTGILDKARGGTIFLDEIAELNPNSQAKLLRVLGSGEYTAVGASELKQTDTRIIAATNRQLETMVQQGLFRQDLYYRIHVLPINLPPLKDRREDIPFLVEHILEKLHSPHKMPSKDLARLLEYDWPGNVRELHNVLERYVAFGNLDFLPALETPPDAPSGASRHLGAPNLREALADFEKHLIRQTLDKYQGNRTRTADALDLPRKTLFRKMKNLGLE
jgi:PAS domain S-box-containing protein